MMWLVCFVLLISVTTAWIPDASRLGQSLVKQVRHRRLQLSAGQQFSCAAMQQAMACNAKAQPTCEGDCEWKADEKKCDIGGAATIQLMMGGGDNTAMGDLMQKGMMCNARTQPTCDGDCEWSADENKCDLDPQVAFHKLCNDVASGTSRAFASVAVLAVALSL